MAVVLDTSFLVDVSRGHKKAVGLLDSLADQGELLIIPSVVVAEYLAGSRDPDHDLEALQSAAELADFTVEDASTAAELARQALQGGRFPGWTDLFVAAFAHRRGGLRIVTANPRHFPDMPKLTY